MDARKITLSTHRTNRGSLKEDNRVRNCLLCQQGNNIDREFVHMIEYT